MSKLSNVELLHVITDRRDDYQLDALIAAENEWAARNLSADQVSVSKAELEQKKDIDQTRSAEPLSFHWKILAAMFPGALQLLMSGILKGDGYDKKARDLIQWTFYGLRFYFALIVLILIINRILFN